MTGWTPADALIRPRESVVADEEDMKWTSGIESNISHIVEVWVDEMSSPAQSSDQVGAHSSSKPQKHGRNIQTSPFTHSTLLVLIAALSLGACCGTRWRTFVPAVAKRNELCLR